MKMKINKLFILAGVGATLGLASCSDTLDKEVFAGAVTSETKEEVLAIDPDMAQASVNAISSGAYQHMTILSGHDDFGLPSIMMMLDSNGQDMISANSGYNWFRPSVALANGTYTSDETYEIWYTSYNTIYACNSVLQTIPADTDDDVLKFYRAQALSFRAFYYWLLSQCYQNTYYGYQNEKCVPVITDENMEQAAIDGIARSTVEEVYEQILSDLNESVELLNGNPVKAQTVMSSKPKRFFNLDTVYGMLARVYLTMHDYSSALEAATNCLNTTSCQPYSIADVSKPTFISLEDSSWLWGQPVSTTDGPVLSGIVNFPSMMGSFSYGYAQYGAWRWCNKNLYDWIPTTDVRKGWFLNDSYKSANLTQPYYDYMDYYGYTDDRNNGGTAIQMYTQVKYAPYNNQIDVTDNASDIPYFRIEEVYYIYYEALAMTGGASNAAAGLTQFVQKYRDPSYVCNATSPEAIQDEIWMQRRVEFWGEGFVAWFDLKRLGKPLDRRGAGYPSPYVYYEQPGAPCFVLAIPQQETQTNKLIPQSENNPQWSAPTPVPDAQ